MLVLRNSYIDLYLIVVQQPYRHSGCSCPFLYRSTKNSLKTTYNLTKPNQTYKSFSSDSSGRKSSRKCSILHFYNLKGKFGIKILVLTLYVCKNLTKLTRFGFPRTFQAKPNEDEIKLKN